ncbi:MAG: hypothetical protein IKX22_02515 [Prevotella sp.]|nr:hypothetical protein [Prevotella sp.]
MTSSRLIILAISCTMLLAGCGKKNDSSNGNSRADSTQTVPPPLDGEGYDNSPFTRYDNQKYGFSVDVPRQMVCTDEPQMAEGANFALSADDVMNLLSLFASENYGGKAFTAEDIKGELDERAASLGSEAGATIDKKEEADGWTLTVTGGEMHHQVYRTRYKDGKRYELSYIYSKEQEQALGGDVERHVMESWKIGK